MLLSNSWMRARMGQKALRMMEERFSVDTMVRAYEELYLTLLNRRPPGCPDRQWD